jgi:hypothetical protein
VEISNSTREALLKDEIVLNKFEVAKLQIDTAIKIFFYDWDVVSQHVLVASAHQILHDIAKKKKLRYSFKDSQLIDNKKRGKYIKAVHVPQNYFKHSLKDFKNRLIFRYQLTQLYLYDTIRMYCLLGNKITKEMATFLMWFQLRYPDIFCFEEAENDLAKIRKGTTDPKSFKLLARVLLEKEALQNK